MTIPGRKGDVVVAMASLTPAFARSGSVTAGNASGLNDGAAAGVDPEIMGRGLIPASRKAMKKAGWSMSELDFVESNEALAAQSLRVLRELGLDPDKVNVDGGAIGHPIGAPGARILTTLLDEMGRRDARKGLATLCVGGGVGVALCVERP